MVHKFNLSLKKFATNARRELCEGFKAELHKYNLPDGRPDACWDEKTRQEYSRLKEILERKGKESVIEKVAHTWFNRLCALRLMEVRGYIPPCISLSTYDLIDWGKQSGTQYEGLQLSSSGLISIHESYRNQLLAQCAELHQFLPFLFDDLDKEEELLLPFGILSFQGICDHLLAIEEEVWWNTEVIGWLYQYYFAEKKTQVTGKVIEKKDIPAATQLFTPQWIVDYMVQNSLGTLWLDSSPGSNLKTHMPYYIDLDNQEPEVIKQLKQLQIDNLDPREIRLLDPACGSGHTLVRAFDILYHIYEECGYFCEDIPLEIIKNNLFGLDIDPQACQMANFAMVIKGRERDPNFFERLKAERFQPNVAPVTESGGAIQLPDPRLQSVANQLIETFKDASNLGSLLKVPAKLGPVKLDRLASLLETLDRDLFGRFSIDALQGIIRAARILQQQYDVVVANPPYMGRKYQNKVLKKYLKSTFGVTCKDLFSAFIIRGLDATKPCGYFGTVSPFVWMFITSFNSFREKLIREHTIASLIQLEYNSGFEGALAPICTFVAKKSYVQSFLGGYIGLTKFSGTSSQGPKALEAIQNPNCGWFYRTRPDHFEAIPGAPFAYWTGERMRQIFREGKLLGEFASPRQGLVTAKNDRFLRRWWEVSFDNIGFEMKNRDEAKTSGKKWFPCDKGGKFCKWYGNNEWVVNWENDGYEIQHYGTPWGKLRSRPQNISYYFKPGVTWSKVTSGAFSTRTTGDGFIFSDAGMKIFAQNEDELLFLSGLTNSKVIKALLECISQTLNFEQGSIARIPVLGTSIDLAPIKKAIELAKAYWDLKEISWNFKHHFMASPPTAQTIEELWEKRSVRSWKKQQELRKLEEVINQNIISLYGLNDILSPHVSDSEVSLKVANRKTETIRFFSYAIGCMAGRYSLDKPGIVHAGQCFDPSLHCTFPASADGIIPLLEEDWFEDDILLRFSEFVRCCWGQERLISSLDFLADILGKGRGVSTARIRQYYIKEFIKDHIKTYKRRPIYWLFTSHPKGLAGGAFQALVYLHRYQPNTLSILRAKHLTRYQKALENEIRGLENLVVNEAKQKFWQEKRLLHFRTKLNEVLAYDHKLKVYADQAIALKLDDGVAYNYMRFSELVYWNIDFRKKDLRRVTQWKNTIQADND